MAKKVAYWTTTVIVAALSLIAARSYLSGEAHAEFARLGYPQQLRIILGIAKLLGAITLVIPAYPDSRSGLTPVSPSLGSVPLLPTILSRTFQRRSCRWSC